MRLPKHYYCEVFRMNYYFCLGWAPDKMVKYLQKDFGAGPEINFEKSQAKCLWINSDQGVIILIWTRKQFDPAAYVHESVHAGMMTLDSRKIDPRHDDGEVLAYVTENVYRQLMKWGKK